MKNIIKNFYKKKLVIIFMGTLVFLLTTARPPEILIFSTDRNLSTIERILASPVHLSDDVMISLRAGIMINDIGKPSLNRSDSAQPSTSYFSPYLFSIIKKVFPDNISVLMFAGLGAIFFALTISFLVKAASHIYNGIFLASAILVTDTTYYYSILGWDHIFQGFFALAATTLALRKKILSSIDILQISLLLFIACAFRPDFLIISFGILLTIHLRSSQAWHHTVRWGLVPFLLCTFAILYANYSQFQHITPTTARLKFGAAPSLTYIFSYLIENVFFNFTALTVFMALILIYFIHQQIFKDRSLLPIIYSCIITAFLNIANSDVFPGYRMMWAPLLVLSASILTIAPKVFYFNEITNLRISFAKIWSINFKYFRIIKTFLFLWLFILLASLCINKLKTRISEAFITSANFMGSPYAQQLVVINWINSHLDPQDGAIGIFFLGMGFHLQNFELADFLGKGDEDIATTQVMWGPPGHNKWNINKTLTKWNPQAILPAGNFDPKREGVIENANHVLRTKVDTGFSSSLVLNERVKSDYLYCYTPSNRYDVNDVWGFYLRRDIAIKYTNIEIIKCH